MNDLSKLSNADLASVLRPMSAVPHLASEFVPVRADVLFEAASRLTAALASAGDAVSYEEDGLKLEGPDRHGHMCVTHPNGSETYFPASWVGLAAAPAKEPT